MKGNATRRKWLLILGQGIWILGGPHAYPQASVVSVEGTNQGTNAWYRRPGGTQEQPLRAPHQLAAGDHVRLGDLTRLTLQLPNQTIVRLTKEAEFQIPEVHDEKHSTIFTLLKGLAYFFHRDRPGETFIKSRVAVAAVRGTDFTVEVDNQERMTVALLDGDVELINLRGSVRLQSGEQGIAEPGQIPFKRTNVVIQTVQVVQWCLYYPGVLNLDELAFTPEEQNLLNESITAYRRGDLLRAMENFPADHHPASAREAVYLAALLLTIGQVERSERLLATLSDNFPQASDEVTGLAEALHLLIAAVRLQPKPSLSKPQLSSSLLAASYYEQSRNTGAAELGSALDLARKATTNAPGFGFAWARVAELEFSFGHTRQALAALENSLNLNPSNAQALTLKGFLLAAENKIREATNWFNKSIQVDPNLGNAWLGRGLGRIRLGDSPGGRDDLLIAAATEPQRALLRSYLGKAHHKVGDLARADHELDLAKNLDPKDPTPWLYGALLDREQFRINESVRELEHSLELNDNRALYRSRMRLDEDRAVRSSSLATLYQSAGMDEVAVREAARAVSYDYVNYSAHLFLSDSYNALRDPTRFNLRSETAWFNELLLANLLSPVGATPLSQHISQQEYSRLFEQNRIGLSSSTEYRSDGQVRELASQFGRVGNTGWAFDLDYQHNDGVRRNNELDRLEWYTTIKQQLTPQDSLLLLAKYQDYHSGDNFQYYQPTNARPHFSFDETQKPIAVGGYHHEWSPGMHTLLLGGRLENDQRFSDLDVRYQILRRDQMFQSLPPGPITGVFDVADLDVDHHVELEVYTAEVQQIWETERNLLLFGGRWQGGHFETESQVVDPSAAPATANEFDDPPSSVDVRDEFERLVFYGYDTFKVSRLKLTAGLTYEYLRYPMNFRAPPIEPNLGTEVRERLNPKAALVWDPFSWATVRGMYTRSLGGVSLDQSFRLEPTQLAGFSQDFRTLIPESLAGSVSAPLHEVWEGGLDLKFKTGTYLGLQGSLLRSDVHQTIGVFEFLANDPAFPANRIRPLSTKEELAYDERGFGIALNQLLANEWTFGVRYSFVHAELQRQFPALPSTLNADSTQEADLQRLRLALRYHSKSRFFGEISSEWLWQNNSTADIGQGIVVQVPNEDLFQLNLFLGYGFPRQRGDLTIGLLNLTDEDYRLNPVTLYAELPRERTFYVRLRFNF